MSTETVQRSFNAYIGDKVWRSAVKLPAGSLSHFLDAIAAGAATIVFWGDGRGEGVDQVELSAGTSYVERFKAAIEARYPACTFTYYNYCLDGRNIQQAQDTSYQATGTTDPADITTGFGRDWSTSTGKSWRQYVKDAAPHLVVLDFGMEGTGENQDYLQKGYLDAILAWLNGFTAIPNLLVLTTYFPTTATKATHLAVSRCYRFWCQANAIACLDVGVSHRMLVDGLKDDEVATRRLDVDGQVYNGLHDYHIAWRGQLTKWTTVNGTLTGRGSGAGMVFRPEAFFDGSVEWDVVLPAASDAYLFARFNSSDYNMVPIWSEATALGHLVVVCTPNSGADASTTGSLVLKAVRPGVAGSTTLGTIAVNWNKSSQHTVKLTFYGQHVRVYLDGVSKLDVQSGSHCLHDGNVGFGTAQTVMPTCTDLRINIGYPVGYPLPASAQADLLGLGAVGSTDNPGGGDSVKIPASLGHAVVFGLFQEFLGQLVALQAAVGSIPAVPSDGSIKFVEGHGLFLKNCYVFNADTNLYHKIELYGPAGAVGNQWPDGIALP